MGKSLVSGVYAIVNLVNGKVYIGSSTVLSRRKANHITILSTKCHPNTYLQRSWNKYGADNFAFIVMEICLPEQCIIKEQEWLDAIEPFKFENGYNRSPSAGSCLGIKHSKETRNRIVLGQRVRRSTQTVSKETRKKLSVAAIGQKRSKDSIEKQAEKIRGRKHTQETLDKIQSVRGSTEYRKRISDLKKAQISNPIARNKIAEATKKAMDNPTLRAKLSASAKARHSREKSERES